MSDYTLTPYIRVAWNCKAENPKWYVSPRVIFDYELIFLYSGELEFMLEDRYYHVLPGDFILIRPMQRHSLKSIGKELIRQPHIHFDLIEDEYSPQVYTLFKELKDVPPAEHKLFRKDILDEIYPDIPPVIRLENYKWIRDLFMAIIHEKEKRMVFSDMQTKGLFLQMFSQLLREITLNEQTGKPRGASIAWDAQRFLNEHLDRNISLDELSESIHVSKYHLCRQFKKVFGVSPMQYHLESRIEHAKYLLGTTTYTIGEIAERVGFPNIYAFSRVFKKKEKIPPSVYRNG